MPLKIVLYCVSVLTAICHDCDNQSFEIPRRLIEKMIQQKFLIKNKGKKMLDKNALM